MLEPALVDVGNPWGCPCGNHVGPFVNTHMEPGGVPLLVCSRCAKAWAVVLGLVDGEKANERDKAVGDAAAARRDAVGYAEELGRVTMQLEEQKIANRELREENEILSGTITQLQGRLRAHAEAATIDMALVGDATVDAATEAPKTGIARILR